MSGGLQVRDLQFAYAETPVLDRFSLSVRPGGLCAVMGQSGAGKSTLVRCLLGLERASGGLVDYGGEVWNFGPDQPDLPLRIIRRLGYVPQSSLLFPHLSSVANVSLPLTEGRHASKREASQRAAEALAAVGVADVAQSPPWRLSGGQQQRVAMARALALRPDIFLLDEPTAAIDAGSSGVVGAAIAADVRARGASAVVVTHNLGFAKRHCDSIAWLSEGRIRWHLPVGEVPIDQVLEDLS